ncbi:META domain-containing protein [Trichothermofontia sp.]
MKLFLLPLLLTLPVLGAYNLSPAAIASAPAIPSSGKPSLNIAQAKSALEGEWVLLGWGAPQNLTPPVANTAVTAKFMGDRLSGSTGCNSYTTSFTTEGANLELGPTATTMKACPDPISQQESQFLIALSGVKTYVITSQGHLHLTYETEAGSGVLAFVPSATHLGAAQEPVPALW